MGGHFGRLFFRYLLGHPVATSGWVKVWPDRADRTDMERILTVEDDEQARSVLSDILTGQGFGVDTADRASGALDLLDRNSYDIVFSDIEMPGMDGIELVRRLVEEFSGNQFDPEVVKLIVDAAPLLEESRQASTLKTNCLSRIWPGRVES